MAAAAAGRIYRYPNGNLREVAVPGQPGRTVADRRLHQLVTVGLLVEGVPDGSGRRPVRVTADGRRALTVWKRWCPVPRTLEDEEKLALRPLLGGEQAKRWAHRAQAEERARREHTEAFAAAAGRQREWDDRDERMRAAWARVEGIRNPCARRPVGWVPTDEEAAAHRLDPAVVEELQADAANPQPRPALPSDPGRQSEELPPLAPVEPEAEQLNLFGGPATAVTG
jgi:DNA-binding PadR family transcriptional regulator